MKKGSKANQLDNLLYSTSQYDEDEGEQLKKQLTSAQNKFLQKKMFDLDDDDDGVDLGNGGSIREDGQNWVEDGDDEGRQWNHQQNAKYCFREIAGNSQQFSQSLSIHRPDLLQSKGMHDNSVNLESINLHNVLNNKKKQQQKVNEVLNTQINDLVQKVEKQECLIKGYKKKIDDLQENIRNLKKQNQQLDKRISDYHTNLSRKDQLFKSLRGQYMQLINSMDEKEQRQKQLIQNQKSMQKQIDKLRLYLKNFTDQDRGVMDFRSISPKRTQSSKSTFSSRDLQNTSIQIQKLRREKKAMQTEFQFTKQDLSRKQEKFKNLEDDYRRKISMKQKKIKQLSDNVQQYREEVLKLKKSNDSNSSTLRQKTIKMQKQLSVTSEKLKQLQSKMKYSVEEVKKKQQKIKQLLTQIMDKNKKITELKDCLQQQQAKNQIQTKLQKQRQNQIDKLEKEVKQLKNDKFNMKREIQGLEKPSNVQQKLRKQLQNTKIQKDKLNKQVTELNQQIGNLEKQVEQRNEKLKEMKKKNDQLSKKSTLIKKRSQDNEANQQKIQQYKQIITKMNKEINQLKKKAEHNQQMANKLYIMQSRMQLNSQKSSDPIQIENQYDTEQINEALREELQLKDQEIRTIKEMHQRQIQRIGRQLNTLRQANQKLESEMNFKQKSLDFIHSKFVEIEKQNAELKANKNILHSSFYDQSYDHDHNQAIHFYENKVADLQKKIQILGFQNKQKQTQLRKIYSDRENSSFQINQLKQRIKDLQNMAIASQPVRKIAPQSLSYQQTIDFLMKMLKRIEKSSEMIRSLSKINQFRIVVVSILKTMQKDQNRLQQR